MKRNCSQTLSKQAAGVFWWRKDFNSVYLSSNEIWAKTLGLRKAKDTTGMSDYEIPCKMSELAGTFREEDIKVMTKQKDLELLEILQYAGDEWGIFLTTKTPLIDRKKQVIGTYGYSINITKAFKQLNRFLWKPINYYKNTLKSYIIDTDYNDYSDLKLSERQSEVLFFLLRGLTVKEIARIMTLSPRTVEDHVENLKSKFNCRTKSEFIALAMDYGFMNFIPKKFFNKQLSIVLD